MFPILYGSPVCLHSNTGFWLKDGRLGAHTNATLQMIQFMNPSGNVAVNNDRTPRLLSYGDRVTLQLQPGFRLAKGLGYGEITLAGADSVPLEFLIVPVDGSRTGQPLSAVAVNSNRFESASSFYLISTTHGYLTCSIPQQNKLMLSHLNALAFNIALPLNLTAQLTAQPPNPIPVPMALPMQQPLVWRSPVQPLMRVPPFYPMHPPDNIYPGAMPMLPEQMLQIAKVHHDKKESLVCPVGGDTFCMPSLLAKIFIVFLLITIILVVLTKSFDSSR